MKSKTKSIDMLQGPLWGKMFWFALPLAFTGMLQQLFNAADVMVLGQFVGKNSMAAVGNNVPVIGMIIGLCMGLALGANVLVARYIGMKNNAQASRTVHTALAMALLFGLVVLLLGELATDLILNWMEVPLVVRPEAENYLRVFLLGMPFIALYNFLAAIYRSQGDTQTPLIALIAASIFNIAANLYVVLGLGMAAAGVAATTVMANGISSLFLVYKLWGVDGVLGIHPKEILKPDWDAWKVIVRIGLPAGIQSMVFSFSNLIIQSAINSLGPETMAGSVAAFTIEINIYCFINAFGLAATTFVSQNFGAGNLERCRLATRVSFILNMVATVLIVGVIVFFGRELMGLFTETEAVIELGLLRIYWVGIPEPISVVMETVSCAMRGYGYSMPPAMVTLASICTTRIIWVYTVFAMEPTFGVLMAAYPISWLVAAIGLFALYWHHQKHVLPKRIATRGL